MKYVESTFIDGDNLETTENWMMHNDIEDLLFVFNKTYKKLYAIENSKELLFVYGDGKGRKVEITVHNQEI